MLHCTFEVFSNELSNVMKTVVLTIRKEKEQTEFVKQWEKSWQDGLFRALTSKDRLGVLASWLNLCIAFFGNWTLS